MRRLLVLLLAGYRRGRLAWLALRGRSPAEEAARRVVSGRSWDEFCDTIKAAGAALHVGGAPQDPATQAEGYRYLSRLVRAGLEAFVEDADPRRPVLGRMVHETIKLGADNPDNDYRTAVLDPRRRYRLRGRRGTVHQLSFSLQSSGFDGGGRRLLGHLDAAELELAADGTFELDLDRTPRARNWLAMHEDAGLLLIRQTYLDRETEIGATLELECVDAIPRGGDPMVPTPEALDVGLGRASLFVAGASLMFSRWADGFRKRPNCLPRFDQTISDAAGGDPSIMYHHGYWELGPGEALVLDFVPPKCVYWNFQLNSYWLESLDYTRHPIHVNKHTARYRQDGSVRIIVCPECPPDGEGSGANWLHTCGHRLGTMTLRWARAQAPSEVAAKVVSTSELRA